MIPMFFVVIRAKFGGEKEDPDEALKLSDAHHAAQNPDGNGSGNQGH
jgi:multidrug efflux pump